VPSLVSQFPRGGSSRQPTWLRKASQMLRPSYRTASNYQKLLQEQRDLLERQLRQTREELAHLRKQVKSNASKSIAVRASNVKAQQGEALRFEETKMHNQQLTELETAMAKLQEMKDRLEALLLEEQEKMAALQVKLEEAETSSEELKAKRKGVGAIASRTRSKSIHPVSRTQKDDERANEVGARSTKGNR
jgi:predicted  nucleic acid-binding Zn-ribbon protein